MKIVFALWVSLLIIGFTGQVLADDAANNYALVSSDGRAAVATVNPYATQIAIDVITRGGNALDAAIAAAFALGVVDGHNSGIGGGCFILVRMADGRILAIDGREMAPAAATRDMFVAQVR
jgi:gamma-glutamyltranspeptidase/glutathione hydrolase